MNTPLGQPDAAGTFVKAEAARKDGDPYLSLSGYPWQEWLVTMTDGTVRRTHVAALASGSGPRAAKRDAEEGPYRNLSQPTYKESAARSRSEGHGAPLDAARLKAWAALGFPDGPEGSPPADSARSAASSPAVTPAARSGRQVSPHADPDPRSAEYARDYDNGWRAAKRSNARLSFGVPVDSARHRDVSRAWRDGFYDQAADHPKWTYRQARLAGWDNVGNYLFARFSGQEWAQELGGLSSHGSEGQQAMDALSAFQGLPSEANWYALGEAMGVMPEAAQPPAVPTSPAAGDDLGAASELPPAENGSDTACNDCGRETLSALPGVPTEHYMVHDQLWQRAGLERGHLCIACLERRLGRQLTRHDFPDVALNDPSFEPTDRYAWSYRTERLKDRWKRQASMAAPRGSPFSPFEGALGFADSVGPSAASPSARVERPVDYPDPVTPRVLPSGAARPPAAGRASRPAARRTP